MVIGVHDVFEKGPKAVIEHFAQQDRHRTADDLDLKLLSDVCWTRASTLVQENKPEEAASWARASLAGYDLLVRSASPEVTRSAREDAAALRSWPLLATDGGAS